MRFRSKDGSSATGPATKRRPLIRRLLRRRPRLSGSAWVLLLILALVVPAIWVLTPSGSTALSREKDNLGMRLGLDLAGGSHLVYQAAFEEGWDEDLRAFHLERAVATIEDRINKYGVAEPVLQQQGDDRILVQLPGITDIDEAKALIEQTGFLEFREIELNGGGEAVTLADYLGDEPPTGFFDESVEGKRVFGSTLMTESGQGVMTLPYFLEQGSEGIRFVDGQGNPVAIDINTLEEVEREAFSWMPAVGLIGDAKKVLTGADLNGALPYYPSPEEMTAGVEIHVEIEWNAEGTALFDQVTKKIRDKGPYGDPRRELGIFLDDELISAPQVFPESMTADSYGSKATITGDFSWEEARMLAIQLDAGALPMPLQKPPLYESEVSATLGKDFINRAVLAGVIGLAVVMLFMMLYYRLPGALASLALLVYVALVLAIFKAIPVTLTLAGLAGFVLSIGMAVDANVLIFERLKEELRAGKTLRAAIETGFNRAWIAIRDSNISTFIICGILYWFGSSIVNSPPVMGFAVTLAIGVAVSMFSAIVVTRTFLRFSAGARIAKRARWFGAQAVNV